MDCEFLNEMKRYLKIFLPPLIVMGLIFGYYKIVGFEATVLVILGFIVLLLARIGYNQYRFAPDDKLPSDDLKVEETQKP